MFNVLMNGESISEKDAILMINKGEPLSSFNPVTDLMALAAVKSGKGRWKEVPSYAVTHRVARNMVFSDFRALERIPEEMRGRCYKEFGANAIRVTRKTEDDYRRILNEQPMKFIRKCVNRSSAVKKFLTIDHANEIRSGGKEVKSEYAAGTALPTYTMPHFDMSFEEDMDGDVKVSSPASFIYLPANEQTPERLYNLLMTNQLFPSDYIKMLCTPNRNVKYYSGKGNAEKAAKWKEKVIPWLNRDVCVKVAELHPEASIDTPTYLNAAFVHHFFEKMNGEISPQDLAKYYCKFPADYLSYEDAELVEPSWEVLRHTPEILAGTEYAQRYLIRHPEAVLRLPAVYQTREAVLMDGVPLTRGGIAQIKDEEFKELLMLAFFGKGSNE